ncbi:MAG TPA: hypothetical protein PLV92_12635 [Pirellulaceae bacterium]|nr:hypothetical protein [Pirellulaceae bacterium]
MSGSKILGGEDSGNREPRSSGATPLVANAAGSLDRAIGASQANDTAVKKSQNKFRFITSHTKKDVLTKVRENACRQPRAF